jgi:hypothetical protein
MARARNIKHAFFMNDDLAEKNCALGRLFFIGLWTLADYKGELEWRAGKIKAQLLPYDDADVKALAINLDKSGFIRFYSDGDKIYLNIVNFNKHQNPHKNEREAGTDIPAYSEEARQVIDLTTLTINRDLSRLNPEDSASTPADSLILIPDSNNSLSKGESENLPPESPPIQFDDDLDEPSADHLTGENLKFDSQFLTMARTSGIESQYSDSDIENVFDLFRCYGANAKTLRNQSDWLSLWRTWCQREKVRYAKSKATQGNQSQSGGQRPENNVERGMRIAREAAERIAAANRSNH